MTTDRNLLSDLNDLLGEGPSEGPLEPLKGH